MRPFRNRVRSRLQGFLAVAPIFLGAGSAALATCGPFTDVAADAFCPFVLEIFTIGITTGTTATTYDPTGNVSRLQMAAFLSRSVDGILKRASPRTNTGRLWMPQNETVLGVVTVGSQPASIQFDGADLWVANPTSSSVSRVRASDGRLLETWTGASGAHSVLLAMNQVIVGGFVGSGSLYAIDPAASAGAVTTVVSSNAGGFAMAFDGARIWSTSSGGASVSIITPGAVPWTVTTVTMSGSAPNGILYDGANIWLADGVKKTLLKLDGAGTVLQTVTVSSNPWLPGFDGTNIWVPMAAGSVAVVRASTGAVLATLTGNGLTFGLQAAFDGDRMLVTSGDVVSLWKAADLTPLGSFSTGTGNGAFAACSDGLGFWITLSGSNKIVRF